MSSLLASIQSKIDGLTAANFPSSTVPPVYEDTAPQLNATSQLRRPFIVINITPMDALMTFESAEIEVSRITITAYADSQADADTIIECLRFNGQNIDQLAGLDAGTLPALTVGTLDSFVCTKPPKPGKQRLLSETAKYVHSTVIEYEAVVERS